MDDPMALLHEAEIVVLLPNSELTKDNNKRTYVNDHLLRSSNK